MLFQAYLKIDCEGCEWTVNQTLAQLGIGETLVAMFGELHDMGRSLSALVRCKSGLLQLACSYAAFVHSAICSKFFAKCGKPSSRLTSEIR